MMKSKFSLVGFEIEGAWNLPLLANAARLSEAALLFADCKTPLGPFDSDGSFTVGTGEILNQFDHVLARETTRQSRSVYEFAMPRGNVALIVGNERNGIPSKLLKMVRQVISVPMFGKGLSSINVAVAAAIILYAAERDIGRKRIKPVTLSHRDLDLLVVGPADASELGSFFRSA